MLAVSPASESSAPAIGRFRLRRRLGEGLQGTVYLAEDPELERPVALKLLRSDRDPDVSGALSLAEGRNLGRLRHPNVVSVFESGLHRGHRFLVFEYVDGRTLAARLAGGQRLPPAAALPLFRQLVEGVAHAHAQQVIHLDLNPNNVMLDRQGVPRIMDFGLSRRAAQRDEHRVFAGTPLYMAPEQFAGGAIGPPADVYALGLILYRMLTGSEAIAGRSLGEIAAAACRGEVDFGRVLAAGGDARIEALLRGALAPRAAQRIRDAGELLRRLDAACAPAAGEAGPLHATVEFLLRRMRLKKELPALAATLVEVNRLTAEDSRASAPRLAQVVLRDYALAHRLLRLANSAWSGVARTPISTVSEAIVRLGFEQVRVACNALLYLGRLDALDERAARLADRQAEAFLGALMARHLAREAGAADPEAAFLCAMFRRLGETLVAYCFPEETEAIEAATAAGATPEAAFREVLGLAPHELGAAVAREWKFPDEMAACMAPVPDPLPQAPTRAERLHALVALAEELAWLMTRGDPADAEAGLERLASRYRAACALPGDALGRLARAAGGKFCDFETAIGFAGRSSPALARLHAWLEARGGSAPQEAQATS